MKQAVFILALTLLALGNLSANPINLTINPIKSGAIWTNGAGDTLELLDGWTLTSEDENFGGLSALELFEGDLVSVSDRGHIINFGSLASWRDGSEKKLDWRETPIDKSALQNRGAETDAESMAISTSGELLITFEREHRIQVHKNLTDKPRTWEIPIALRRPAPLGFGIEAMTTLRDGQIFAVSEKVKRQGGFRAYLITGFNGQNRKLLTYIPEEDWMPSAATTLPWGDVLLIERRASAALLGFRSRLMILREKDLKEGAKLKPEELFTFAFGSVGADNLEGALAIRHDNMLEIWMITDDNFKPFQRTRLMRFSLNFAEPQFAPEPVFNLKPKQKPKAVIQ